MPAPPLALDQFTRWYIDKRSSASHAPSIPWLAKAASGWADVIPCSQSLTLEEISTSAAHGWENYLRSYTAARSTFFGALANTRRDSSSPGRTSNSKPTCARSLHNSVN
jgi:hypothetical protein